MKDNKHQIQCGRLCWKRLEGARAFVLCWQIATKEIKSMQRFYRSVKPK